MVFAINKRFIGLIVVLILAVFSWWLQQREDLSQGVEEEGDGHVVDYAIRDFEMAAMDDTGKPRHHLTALSMEHYADDDSAKLERPNLQVYRKNGEPWVVKSDSALVYQGGSVVHMQGAVQMRRLDEAGQTSMQVDTRDLWVYADQEYAESAEAVVIQDSMGVTRAEGMKVDIKAGRLQLLAAVRGEYTLER